MRRKSFAEMDCPIARTLEIVGDWWTLLIVRDALIGVRRFDEFRQTGIADNILSARLDALVREGILARRAYQERPLRYEYLLTEKGHDLLPVIASLGRWGMTWTDVQAMPPRFVHLPCGSAIAPNLYCPACQTAPPAAEIEVRRDAPSPDPANAEAQTAG